MGRSGNRAAFSFVVGSGSWNRTTVNEFKARCSTIELIRHPPLSRARSLRQVSPHHRIERGKTGGLLR
jgi:hypothetical protein